MTEITFIAHEAEEGGYYARAVEDSIFTEAYTWDELQLMIKEAIDCHFMTKRANQIRFICI